MIRNCSGLTPPPMPTVYHPRLPEAVLTRDCPMRSLKHPTVQAYLPLYGRMKRYDVMPAGPNLDDQLEQCLAAFDAIEVGASATPPKSEDPA